ncbi:MAG: nuclear transport factor 2 family protein [Mycolicibacterium neoaurum]|uniref:nuclear transport factor 2 family protein n=1 Tax=Mycolicibacterium neoaurum TaxID=1795 RepID=UPI002FF85871
MALSTDDTAIRELEKARYAAVLNKDFEHFEALCHPELIYTHSNGDTDTLASYLAKVRSGFYVYHEIEHPIAFIRFVENLALVVGEMNAELTAAGVTKKLRNNCLAVWLRTGDAWRLLAYQPTPRVDG